VPVEIKTRRKESGRKSFKLIDKPWIWNLKTWISSWLQNRNEKKEKKLQEEI